MKLPLLLALLSSFLSWTTAAAEPQKTLRLSPQTISTLPARLAAEPTIREIVLEAGVYHAGVSVEPIKEVDAAQHPLLIRAEDGAEVIFDGSHPAADLHQAVPVTGRPGVFAIPFKRIGRESPKLWEPASRIRYAQVADVASVAAWAGTYATDGENLFFQTSDGKAPSPGQVMMNHGHLDYGMYITRSHVTVRGIAFRHFLARVKWSTAIQLRGDHSTIDNCTAFNCSTGFTLVGHRNTVCRGRIDDCGGGIYVGGNEATVEDCRIFKRRDAFLVPGYEQDDSGIQYYHPATNGVLRGNVVGGFSRGITLKCEGVFLVEHNTIVDCHEAILRTVPQAGDRYERNLIVGCGAPGMGNRMLRPGVVNDFNVFWDLKNVDEFVASMQAARLVGTGQSNVIADPRFLDREGGDLRLAPGSICAAVTQSARPVGALEMVTTGHVDSVPPTVRLELLQPAVEAGAVGQMFFERDPWIGGGTTFLQNLHRPHPEVDYDTSERQLSLQVHAYDALGRPRQMQIRVGDEPWRQAQPYVRALTLELPDRAQIYPVALKVADEAGNWSDPAVVRVRLTRQSAALDGGVTLYTNQHGVVLSFRSSAPAFASVEYSSDLSFAHSVSQVHTVYRRWNSNDGGDYVTRWREPRILHHLAVTAPQLKKGETYHYRIVLENPAGHVTRSEPGTFNIAGPARTWTVNPAGHDTDAAGAAGLPVRTLQFAIDRALPGDRILVQQGVYSGDNLFSRGGLPEAPLTLEGATGAAVILDSARRNDCLLRLENAPHVVIRNFTLRGYGQEGAGIYLADSSDVTIENCNISNWVHGEGWPIGQGIFAHRSPGLTARGNIVHRQENGIFLLVSPRATIMNNTAFRNLYKGLCMYFSCAGTRVVNNALVYNQSDQIGLEEPDRSALESMICDYNNLATRLDPQMEGEVITTAVPEDPELQRGDSSKAIVWTEVHRYRDVNAWRKAFGKDMNSIFADPKFVDASRGDFRLKPDSPHRGAGEGGATIGALTEAP